jgi:hypothetical protein
VRPHPGNDAPKTPLSADLKGAHCVVIWSSSAGVKALIEGIPVVSHSPFWICKPASFDTLLAPDVLVPCLADAYRLGAMNSLAWAQWSVNEIAEGIPFRHLLSDTRQVESAAALHCIR